MKALKNELVIPKKNISMWKTKQQNIKINQNNEQNNLDL